MSVWGDMFRERKDTTGRIMAAIERTADAQRNTAYWTVAALRRLENEVIGILADDRLPGYQALGAKCAELEARLDAAIQHSTEEEAQKWSAITRAEVAEAALAKHGGAIPAWVEEARLEAYNQAIKDAQAKILWMLGGNRTLEELGVELVDGHNAEGSQMLCAYWGIGDLEK